MESIGQRLQSLRKNKGLSLRDVGTIIGTSDATLCKIENNENKTPSPLILKKLAELYDADLISLYIGYGYLNTSDISKYQQIFRGTEKLSESEKMAIQQIVNIIINKD